MEEMTLSKLTNEEAEEQYSDIIAALIELTDVYTKHLEKSISEGLVASVFTLSKFYKNFILTAKELVADGIIDPGMLQQLDDVLATVDRNLATIDKVKTHFGGKYEQTT